MSESGAKKRKKLAEAAQRHAKLMEKVPKLSTFFVAGSNVASSEASVIRISETTAGMNRRQFVDKLKLGYMYFTGLLVNLESTLPNTKST